QTRKPNLAVQRTGASRFAQRQIERHQRLAPVAHLCLRQTTLPMKAIRFILMSLVAFAATLCMAGTAWHYKCEAPKCGFEGDLGIGGGFVFHKATGYCTTCKKFISMSWKAKGVTGDMKKIQDKTTNLL